MSRLVDVQDHSRKRGRKAPHERAAIFSPHLAGSRAGSGGVWAGGHTTNTRQSKTLFVTNVDPRVTIEQVAALFEKEPGFFAFRTVRRMFFVDFASIGDANLSMRKYQNHVFVGLDPTSPHTKKLLIDYDKDDPTKRDTQFAAQVGREVDADENAELVELTCAACGQFLLKLRIPAPKTFATLPRRPVDQSLVIDTNKYVTELQIGKGEERAIKRPGGVEMQYRLVCKSCQLSVGYASTPFDQKIKHVFVLDGAMRGERKEIRAGRMVRGAHADKFEVRAPTASTNEAEHASTAPVEPSSSAAAQAASSPATTLPSPPAALLPTSHTDDCAVAQSAQAANTQSAQSVSPSAVPSATAAAAAATPTTSADPQQDANSAPLPQAADAADATTPADTQPNVNPVA